MACFFTSPEHGEKICQLAIQNFDNEIRDFYEEADLQKGGIESIDRQGNKLLAPILSVSFAVIISDGKRFSHPGQIAQVAAEVKKQAKKEGCSYYLINRRNNAKA